MERLKITPGAGTLRVGDIITFSGRPKWWRRVLIRFGWAKVPEPKQFTVTWSSSPD